MVLFKVAGYRQFCAFRGERALRETSKFPLAQSNESVVVAFKVRTVVIARVGRISTDAEKASEPHTAAAQIQSRR